MGDLDDAQGATEGNCLRVLTDTVAAARPQGENSIGAQLSRR